MTDVQLKAQVRQHWEGEVCGSRNGAVVPARDWTAHFASIDEVRYRQEPMLAGFARWPEERGKAVLEVGLGTGADFIRWLRAGAVPAGRDLTAAAVAQVEKRIELEGFAADVRVGDAEVLDFPDNSFDLYYAWGVLHHTPDTPAAVQEAYRVLKPGGRLRIMIYHYPSVMSLLTWLVTGPLRFRWMSPRQAVFENMESPGTKMYTRGEARAMVRSAFPGNPIAIRTYLCPGDLLSFPRASGKFQGLGWRCAMALYPAWLVRLLGNRWGGYLTIEATK